MTDGPAFLEAGELGPGCTDEQARAHLEERGWQVIGAGDWATVLGHPDGEWCVRLAPADPAYRLVADDLLAGPPHRWLPRVAAVLTLAGAAYAVLIERLFVPDPAIARAFCAALGLPSVNDDDMEEAVVPGLVDPDDPDLAVLRRRLSAVASRGAARYPRLWGGSDVRPGNVLADAAGSPRLVDPFFLTGAGISAALRAGDRATLDELDPAEVEGYLRLPCFHREHDRYDGVEELRACWDRLRRR